MFDPSDFLDLLAQGRTSDDEIVDLDGCVIRVSDFVDAVSLTAEERADAEGCVSAVHYRRHLDDRVAEAGSRLSTAEIMLRLKQPRLQRTGRMDRALFALAVAAAGVLGERIEEGRSAPFGDDDDDGFDEGPADPSPCAPISDGPVSPLAGGAAAGGGAGEFSHTVARALLFDLHENTEDVRKRRRAFADLISNEDVDRRRVVRAISESFTLSTRTRDLNVWERRDLVWVLVARAVAEQEEFGGPVSAALATALASRHDLGALIRCADRLAEAVRWSWAMVTLRGPRAADVAMYAADHPASPAAPPAEETTASPVEEPTEPPTEAPTEAPAEEPAEPPAEEPRDQTRNAPPLTIGAITPKVGPPIRVGRGPKVLGST